MLLTHLQENMIFDYYRGTLSEEDRKTVEKWDQQSVKFYGCHLLKMPLTSAQKDLLERCRQYNLTTEEKKQVLELNQQSVDYCEEDLLSPAMDDYCRSAD